MTNPVSKIVGSALGKITDSGFYKKYEGKINRKTVENVMAVTTIASVAAKDTVGCGMYVYQSMNNKEIPEKRRIFVSALDLTNGGLMVLSQIGMFLAVRKINEKAFMKLFKSFNKEGSAFRQYAEQMRVWMKKLGYNCDEISSKGELRNEFVGMKDIGLALFKPLTELVASTIIAKRIIVPFIATPLANQLKSYWERKHADEYQTQDSPAQVPAAEKQIPSQTPALTANITVPVNKPSNLLETYKK